MMSNKNLLIIGAVIIVVAGIFGAFFLARGGEKSQIAPTPQPTPEIVVEFLPQDALDVTLKAGSYPRYVLTIDKIPKGVTGLSYEMTYDTTNKGSQGLTGGAAEPIVIKEGQAKYVNNQVVFGSESRGKYDLDKGVSNIQINIRLTYSDGSEKGWKGTLEI